MAAKELQQEYHQPLLHHREYNWDISKFPTNDNFPYGYWNDKSHQRAFFDNIARELRIQNAFEWYKVKHKDIIDRPGASAVLRKYNHSLLKGIFVITNHSSSLGNLVP